MKLGMTELGHGRAYVIAEMSCNHAGRLEYALDLVRAAKASGADAIKFQHYTPETMGNAERPITEGPWAGQTQGALYAEAAMPWAWTPTLVAECDRLDLDWLSTPYDVTALKYLTETPWMRPPVALKVASFELTDTAFLDAVAAVGMPVILSTGMATLTDIVVARDRLRTVPLAFLHCVSAYPCPASAANLPQMAALAAYLSRHPIGFSDHTSGIGAAVAAATQGAVIIEKHLKLAEAPQTADAAFSLDESQFAAMVTAIREAEAAIRPADTSDVERPSQQFRRAPGGPRGSYAYSTGIH